MSFLNALVQRLFNRLNNLAGRALSLSPGSRSLIRLSGLGC
jgi:hypothetical protein